MIDGFKKGWDTGGAIAGEMLGFFAPAAIVFAAVVAGAWFLVRKVGL